MDELVRITLFSIKAVPLKKIKIANRVKKETNNRHIRENTSILGNNVNFGDFVTTKSSKLLIILEIKDWFLYYLPVRKRSIFNTGYLGR